MKTIELSKNKITVVDDDDFEWLNQWKWSCNADGYACRNYRKQDGTRSVITMHREITKPEPYEDVDHISRDRLDNRRSNLRICSRAENNCNRSRQRNNVSGVTGVYWQKAMKRWKAEVRRGGKYYFIGYFATLRDAKEAREHFSFHS